MGPAGVVVNRTTENASKVLSVGFLVFGIIFLMIFVVDQLDLYLHPLLLWGLLFAGLGILFARPWGFNPFFWLDWSTQTPEPPAEKEAKGRREQKTSA